MCTEQLGLEDYWIQDQLSSGDVFVLGAWFELEMTGPPSWCCMLQLSRCAAFAVGSASTTPLQLCSLGPGPLVLQSSLVSGKGGGKWSATRWTWMVTRYV
jgi:hypothetical protein